MNIQITTTANSILEARLMILADDVRIKLFDFEYWTIGYIDNPGPSNIYKHLLNKADDCLQATLELFQSPITYIDSYSVVHLIHHATKIFTNYSDIFSNRLLNRINLLQRQFNNLYYYLDQRLKLLKQIGQEYHLDPQTNIRILEMFLQFFKIYYRRKTIENNNNKRKRETQFKKIVICNKKQRR